MKLVSIIVFPFAWLYLLITDLRNWLYTNGYKKSHRFAIPVISIGNLTVGGTGKTPHVEYLIRFLKAGFQIATLSRGYGRQTRGFILATDQVTATQIGDEPMQFFQKFGSGITVAVGEKRAEAIPEIIAERPQTELVLLDDAFQHRAVSPALAILLTDYNRPFYRDYALPAGRLRERRNGAQRADIIIVSKCPDSLSVADKNKIAQHIRKYCRKDIPLYFSGIRYGDPVAFGAHSQVFNSSVLLVSGLANAKPLEKFVQETYNLRRHLAFPDHHAYTIRDISTVQNMYQQCGAKAILVTEKDYVKLNHPDFAQAIHQLPFFYLPIQVHFLFGEGESFNEKVREAIVYHSN